jgi:hypothetical protein
MIKLASAAVLFSMLPLAVQAFPAAPFQIPDETVVMLVTGCGKGNHRNNAGQCVNGAREKVGRPSPSGVCPPGTSLGNRGGSCRRND